MARTEQLRTIVEPIVASLDATIYDLEFEGGSLRLTLDRPGGIDLDTIAEATRQVSRQLDLDDPIPGAYTLEVTSPGLERTLRLPGHWTSALGERVRVKTKPHVDGERRVDGVVASVAGDRVTITTEAGDRTLDIADIDRARTVFVWGPQPKPGGPRAATPSTDQRKSGRGTGAFVGSEATVPSEGGHDPSEEHV